jgi:hypothetical protein
MKELSQRGRSRLTPLPLIVRKRTLIQRRNIRPDE